LSGADTMSVIEGAAQRASLSLLIGATAGAVVAFRGRRRAPLSGHGLLAVGVALLTASLGCLRLGMASAAGVALGLIIGRASVRGATTSSR
jgi:hypothetical protein